MQVSFTHLFPSSPSPVFFLHCQPAKPDSQAAYQAFRQPDCLIVLSKHPPAFCLPPPPQKPPKPGICCPPPPLSFISVRLPGFRFLHSIKSFPFFSSQHVEPNCFPIQPRDSWIGLWSFPFQVTDGLRKYLPACGLLQTSCIPLVLSLSHIFHFALNTEWIKRGWRWVKQRKKESVR